MADDTKLRLVLRGHTIASEAAVTDVGGELFVAVQKPPPVGSLLEAFDGDDRRFLEVARVVETDAGERGRGLFGRMVDDDEGRLARVGSEHLADGTPVPAGERPVSEEEESASSYPVPAPVLEAEPSEPIDLGHPADAPAAQAEPEPEPEPEPESESEPAAAAAESEADAAPQEDKPKGRGKKRKGRKRG